MEPIKITYCSCSKYLKQNKWKPYKNLKELIADNIKAHYPKAKLDFDDFELPDKPKQKVENTVIAKVKGNEHAVKVIVKLAKCSLCEKEGTEYFEAVLQVRSSNADVLEKSVELLQKRVENLRHRGMFINKVKRSGEGYDLYMTNRKIAQALGRALFEAYGGVFKSSPHLHSRNRLTSKNIYRVNIFVRLPGFIRGDFIVTDNDRIFKVNKLGKKIKLLDLDKKSTINADYKKLSYHILKKHSTYVSRVRPDLEVIHPLDYQSSPVVNPPKKKPELGDEVNVVVHKGCYIVD